MKRFLAIAVLLFCASTLHANRVAAQCGTRCTVIVDADLKVIGHGCVVDTDNRQTCIAHQSGCNMNDCGGSGLILSTKGAVLASAEFCGGHVREVRPVTIVQRRTSASQELAAATHQGRESRALRLPTPDDPTAVQ